MDLDVLRLFAVWSLAHETADEAYKAAVERGRAAGPEGMTGGPDAFTDGLAALVEAEKDRLKVELAAGGKPSGEPGAAERALEEVRFEIGEVRGRLEAMETALDALVRRLDAEPRG